MGAKRPLLAAEGTPAASRGLPRTAAAAPGGAAAVARRAGDVGAPGSGARIAEAAGGPPAPLAEDDAAPPDDKEGAGAAPLLAAPSSPSAMALPLPPPPPPLPLPRPPAGIWFVARKGTSVGAPPPACSRRTFLWRSMQHCKGGGSEVVCQQPMHARMRRRRAHLVALEEVQPQQELRRVLVNDAEGAREVAAPDL